MAEYLSRYSLSHSLSPILSLPSPHFNGTILSVLYCKLLCSINSFLLLVGKIDLRLGNDFSIINMMLITLIKLNAFITVLYGYESNYQHNYSIRTLILIATMRMSDRNGLSWADSLAHSIKMLKVNAARAGSSRSFWIGLFEKSLSSTLGF